MGERAAVWTGAMGTLLLLACSACRAPTEVTIEISTDVPCNKVNGTTITVGQLGEIETRPPSSQAVLCTGEGAEKHLGTLVVVPTGDRNADFAFKVITGVDRNADLCTAPEYKGCIVARRALHFLPHENVQVAMVMRAECKDVACDPQSTCFRGECVPADGDPTLDGGVDARVDSPVDGTTVDSAILDSAIADSAIPDSAIPDTPPETADADAPDVSCGAGRHVCGAVCASDLDPATCGTSCTACPTTPRGSASCDGTSCGIACDPGTIPSGGGCIVPSWPRPIAPLSSATVSMVTPTFTWVLAPGSDATDLQICGDRACTSVVQTLTIAAPATTTTLSVALSTTTQSIYWFRLFGKSGGVRFPTPSPTHELVVRQKNPTTPMQRSWGTMPDVDQDGFAEVIVGAPKGARVALFHGSPTGLSPTAKKTLDGAPGSSFGASVASAGDVDGDGYSDVVVGSPGTDRAFVYLGSASGIASTAVAVLRGPAGSAFGTSVSSAGDVNADGYADVIVGAPAADAAFVYAGGPSGVFFGSPLAKLVGPAASAFGTAVGSVGDLDGKGFAEVIVGAPATASAFVHAGSATGLSTTPTKTLTAGGATSRFGTSIAGSGDINFDGLPDVVVGAPGASSAFVYCGTVTGLPTAATYSLVAAGVVDHGISVATGYDVDYNGYDDVFVGSGANAVVDYLGSKAGPGGPGGFLLDIPPPAGATSFGRSISMPGHTDGDRYADLAIGSSSDKVFVYEGSNAGISSSTAVAVTLSGAAGSDFGKALACRPLAPRTPRLFTPAPRLGSHADAFGATRSR